MYILYTVYVLLLTYFVLHVSNRLFYHSYKIMVNVFGVRLSSPRLAYCHQRTVVKKASVPYVEKEKMMVSQNSLFCNLNVSLSHSVCQARLVERCRAVRRRYVG